MYKLSKNITVNVKLILLLLLLNYMNPIIGQQSMEELPEIMPPSPTAFQMTKYGDVPINESSGRISPSIPIYTYTVGKLQLPITLDYIGNGVKVEQIPGWTGINWNLNTGGVITRIVRDVKDEQAFWNHQRILYDPVDFDDMVLIDKSDDVIHLNTIESIKSYDTQADIFNFLFAGHSGSFYLDKDLKPVLANYESELQIEYSTWSNSDEQQEIIITTQEGIRYYFGGSTATEQTQSAPGSPESFSATTSFYLNKIQHPSGDIINFEYGTESIPYNLRISQSQHIQKVSGANTNCGNGPSTSLDYATTSFQNCIIHDGKYLKRIYAARSNLEVRYSSDASILGYSIKRVMNSISIFNTKTNKKLKDINLGYISNNDRFFIKDVSFYGYSQSEGTSSDKIKYEMEYDDPLGLPNRSSFAQDHLGYFNGKVHNATLLPKNNTPDFESLNDVLADREPDFEYATKGSLIKLTYPTGGYTTFEYEAPPVKTLASRRLYLKTYCGQANLIPSEKLKDYQGTNFLEDENTEGQGLPLDQKIEINVNVNADGNINHHYRIYVRVTDVKSGTVQDDVFVLAPDIYQYNKVFSFELKKDRTYKVELELEPDPAQASNPASVYVNAYFDFNYGYENIDGLGIRIKRTSDYGSDNSKPIIKRFYYKKAVDINQKFEANNLESSYTQYIYHTPYVKCCSSFGVPGQADYILCDDYSIIHLQSNSVNSLFPTTDNAWYYKDVTISLGGDNFENGGVQKSFTVLTAHYPYNYLNNSLTSRIYETGRDNYDLYNKKLRKEIILKKDSENQLCKLKEIDYEYEEEYKQTITNMIIKRIFTVLSLDIDNTNSLEGLYTGLFQTHSISSNLLTVSTKEYIDPVPLSIDDESPYKKIITQTNHSYSELVGLPTATSLTSSAENKVIKTKTYYPNMLEEISNNSELGGIANNLENSHILSTPLQQESYLSDLSTLNEKRLSTNRFLYNLQGLPMTIKSSTGDNLLETKINYLYDIYGNITQVQKADDNITQYVWGYNHAYPIAKIERAIAGIEVLPDKSQTTDATSLINAAIGSSDNDIDDETEETLRSALEALRLGLPENMVTTYTYDPFVGVTSITDPNGKTSYYNYDNFGRLSSIKDFQKNILSHYQTRHNLIVKFQITSNVSEFGSITLSANEVKAGESCTVNILPNPAYAVTDLIVNGESKGGLSTYVIENIQENQIVEVNFEKNAFIVSTSQAGNGTIHLSSNIVEPGGSCTITIEPFSGFHVTDLIINGESKGSHSTFTIENVQEDLFIEANYAINTYNITGQVRDSNLDIIDALVSLSTGETIPTYDGLYSFTVLHGWTGSLSVFKEGYVFSPGQITLHPVSSDLVNQPFIGTPITFVISGQVNTANGLAISEATVNLSTGQSVTTTSSGQYSFTVKYGWTGTVSVSKPGYSFPSSPHNFTDGISSNQLNMNFTGELTLYTISGKALDQNGTPISGAGVASGLELICTTTPTGTYSFNVEYGWCGDLSLNKNGYKFSPVKYNLSNVTTNRENVNFTGNIHTYTVTASKTGSGTMTPSGNPTVNYGSNITYIFTPATGYHVKNVIINGTSIGITNSYTFSNITSNQTLLVEFEINSYIITGSRNNSFGTISPLGNTSVNYGSSITYNITPSTGAYIKDIKVNGVSIGARTSYTFVSINLNQTIVAEFDLNTYIITATQTGNGSVTPSGNTSVNYYSKTKYDFVPASGYHIADVLVNNEFSLGAVSTYTFQNVLSNKNVLVKFERDPYLDMNISSLEFPANGGTKTFTISSNVSWSISKGNNDKWITITPVSGSNSATISVSCTKFLGARRGTITITGNGFTRQINVDQPEMIME